MSAPEKPLHVQFLEIAKPDAITGKSRKVTMEELIKANPKFLTTNGGSWCRSDGGLSKYNIERTKYKNKIIAVQLMGYKEIEINKAIRTDIHKQISQMKCVLLAVANDVQVDHKNGRYDDSRVLNPATQEKEDFQPLTKIANTAKRGHCRKCSHTGERFDAKILGYGCSTWTGGLAYEGTCVGCFWYDPLEFNAQVSRNFKSIDEDDEP